jgi:hypothetical protein
LTPQSPFFVLAPIRKQREEDLLALLDSMNASPGHADPANALVPFGNFERLHFARICLVTDKTVGDVTAYGLTPRAYPVYLAFLGDVDESADTFLEELATSASAGLRKIFACCEGFEPDTNLLDWMRRHGLRASAAYVNWNGRTMLQIREEAALHASMERYLDANAQTVARAEPLALHDMLRHFLSSEIAAARLTMTPAAPTRFGWWVRDFLETVLPPLVVIAFSPILLVVGVVLLLLVRVSENSDPEICPRVDPQHVEAIATSEDRDVTNAFSAIGSLKPGAVRLAVSLFGLGLLNYAAQHIYTSGRLARVRTIHFARWVWCDGKSRLMFMSNYDGSLESYMDDFINKAGFGLNFVFSNGIGYPKTRWLVADGAKDEQKFKNFLRRHEFQTQVWYNAHAGLTAVDLERNSRIRNGLEARSLSARQAGEWAASL